MFIVRIFLWSFLASLSRDHKPSEEDEYKRIISSNGRVCQMRTEYDELVGPYRVWLKDQDTPGLAMSRSIGDQIGSKVGIIPVPEIIERTLNLEDKFIIIGSDGIWEFISNEEAVKLVVPYWEANDSKGACEKLISVAVNYWETQDEVVDDITAIVIFLCKA